MVDNSMINLPAFSTVTLINSILVILIAYLLIRIITFILTWSSERAGQYRITVKMVIPLLKFTIYGIALYYILANILKLSSEQLVLFGGLLGAGIGFGLKDLFADVIGGMVITFEKPYHVGDKIKMGDYYGEVIDIGIRSTRLVTPDDNVVSVPNFLIFTQAVASANAGTQEMMVVIELFIDSGSDSAQAMKILKEAVITSKYVFVSNKRPFTVLLKDFPFYRHLSAKAYVNDLRYEFEFESEVTRRTWEEFAKNGIKAPKVNVMDAGSKI
ncbi:MAG: mechanosensitive ion channel [Candidatus Methanoperedens sp.]|jgi:small-conductance mechanosensitive channel|nr:mechanosensitive ion channel [Candidatus Methanoperedens sp.]PKL53900.1 MAG: mechanosensitive ion channel protein MscS [Candidatus Methanoperedenaceae archaeon HGW-Methanoperedenaceae-1]